MSYLSIGAAAAMLGVAVSTLRRWEAEGRLQPTYRTPGNHRRYAWEDLQALIQPDRLANREQRVIGYARVSSTIRKAIWCARPTA